MIGLVLLVLIPTACDYAGERKVPPPIVRTAPLPVPNKPGAGPAGQPTARLSPLVAESADQKERREAILSNVIRLIQTAGITPGGKNFEIATKNLNQYFEQGTKPQDYVMDPATKKLLLEEQIPPQLIKEFETINFDPRYDGRHIEDCMLYHDIANRVAGEGDDLTRVRRLFDWMIGQVQLVPPESLAPTGLKQAQARPYDVLLRGMATEQGYWTERGWLFMALCRQLGIDAGIVTYTPRTRSSVMNLQPNQSPNQPITWICVALIDDKAYLFDQRLGVAIPDARGDGVATLEDAVNDPQILARLDLPGQVSYGITRADLASSPSKVGILIDSSRGYFSPKMRLLQSRLTGKNRTILFRDPVEQRAHYSKVLGDRLGGVNLWFLPLQVEIRLFSEPQFVQSTQVALRLFDNRLPLLYARMAQLRGEIPDAIQQFVAFRYAKGAVMKDKEKTPIVASLQRELDAYATYFLALCHLERGDSSRAELFFNLLLKTTPQPTPEREKCFMFRWGANTNLGHLAIARGDIPAATRYLTQFDPTPQSQGNYWLARETLWSHPLSGIADPLPLPPSGLVPGSADAAAR